MSKCSNLPIIIGCYDKADKCVIACETKNLGSHNVLICRLKEPQEHGAEVVDADNVGSVIAHLHFCKLEAAQAFRDTVNKMVKKWEEEING